MSLLESLASNGSIEKAPFIDWLSLLPLLVEALFEQSRIGTGGTWPISYRVKGGIVRELVPYRIKAGLLDEKLSGIQSSSP